MKIYHPPSPSTNKKVCHTASLSINTVMENLSFPPQKKGKREKQNPTEFDWLKCIR